jgi:preprotein translocase subunit SecG
MKCEVCAELLEEYLDGELEPQAQAQVGEHLIACADCSTSFAALAAEQQLFARYDRELEVPPFLWTRVAAHTVAENNSSKGWAAFLARPLAGVIAVLLLAIALGIVYLSSRRPQPNKTVADSNKPAPSKPENKEPQKIQPAERKPEFVAAQPKQRPRVKPAIDHVPADQSDVLSSDLAYLDMDEQDTARHIEQTQNLLRSIRNVPISDNDEEIDVTYDKALSRRLLNENVVLRRDAEMKAKFPTKTLLADLEPFLIDIANLPDHARAEDVRVIKERVQKTEIVAALLDYQDRGTNNR